MERTDRDVRQERPPSVPATSEAPRARLTIGTLMLVVAVCGLLIAIAIPAMRRARIASNETSAIGTLRTLSTSQCGFQSAAIVDQDDDGTGEFGWLQELSGTTGYRDAAGGLTTTPTSPAFFTSVLGTTANANGGVASRRGYSYLVYLPTELGPAKAEAAPPPTFTIPNDANRQEVAFACYAFPTSLGLTGRRTFVVSQQGEIFATTNRQGYGGSSKAAGKIPPASAAYVVGPTEDAANLEGQFVTGTVAADGQLWLPAGN